jgi:hypothetical protein
VSGLAADDGNLLEALRQLPDELRRVIHGRSLDELRRPSSDGGWGPIEHLAHVRDWEEIFLGRVAAVLEQDRPELPAYDDALWSIERDYSARQPDRELAEFAGLRAEVVALVERAPNDAWERQAVHALAGLVNLRWLLARLHDHGQDHVRQVRDLIA